MRSSHNGSITRQLFGGLNVRRPARTSPAFDLCPSKLAVPSLRRGTLRRSSLISRLRSGRNGRFVSIVAPAGYGKTTLIVQWAARDRRPFAWVSLDASDNDPVSSSVTSPRR